jgi:tetratricopeptide (TPR) repeat protein
MRTLFLFAAASLAIAGPAAAGITVIGNSSARLCYEATETLLTPRADVIRHCDEALELEALSDYDRVATLVNRGILKLRTGRVDDAIADFDLASARDPRQAEAYLNKGLALLRRPDGWEQALPLFDTALERDTRKPALAYYARGVANELGGRVSAAFRDYQQANRLDPKWAVPKADLARFKVRSR